MSQVFASVIFARTFWTSHRSPEFLYVKETIFGVTQIYDRRPSPVAGVHTSVCKCVQCQCVPPLEHKFSIVSDRRAAQGLFGMNSHTVRSHCVVYHMRERERK